MAFQSLWLSFAFPLLSLPHSSDSPACLRTHWISHSLQSRRTNLGFCLVCVLGHVLLLDFSLLWPVAIQTTLSASSTWNLHSWQYRNQHPRISQTRCCFSQCATVYNPNPTAYSANANFEKSRCHHSLIIKYILQKGPMWNEVELCENCLPEV